MSVTLTIGSRGSQLALWQARWVQARLASLGVETRIEIIRTTGDKITGVPLAKVGGKGLFTKEIEEALLDGRVDLAVHSLKDLPTELPAGLALAAIPEREEPFDALIGATLEALPRGARVGTSSLRRGAQLRALRPDLIIESIRGNLDTRLRKLEKGQFDAIMLAAAGLRRLGWADRIAEVLPAAKMCPAVGQGALAVETRESGEAMDICAQLDHAATRAAVTAERALLAGLGGGCQVPIGAYAEVRGERLHLSAIVANPDGTTLLRHQCDGPSVHAAQIGAAAADAMLQAGARLILAEVYGAGERPLAGRRVVVTRARDQAAPLCEQLAAQGAEVLELPAIELVAMDFTPVDLSVYHWLVFTSANAARFFWQRIQRPPKLAARVCAVGPATGAALAERGIPVHRVAAEYIAEGVVQALSEEDLAGRNILLPCSSTARDVLPRELAARGANVVVVPVYRNVAPDDLAARAGEVFARKPHWITFLSPSAVNNVVVAAGADALRDVKIASIGAVTSAAVRQHGLVVTVEASPSTSDDLVREIAAFERQKAA